MFGISNTKDTNQSSSLPDHSTTNNGSDKTLMEMGDIIAYVGAEVTFKGTIHYKGSVRIDGRMEGEIFTDGVLIVGEKAVLSAKIEAGTVLSQGHIIGDIMAKEKVKMLAPAVFEGVVKTPSLSIDEGVLFDGTCQMQNNGEGKEKDHRVIELAKESLNRG